MASVRFTVTPTKAEDLPGLSETSPDITPRSGAQVCFGSKESINRSDPLTEASTGTAAGADGTPDHSSMEQGAITHSNGFASGVIIAHVKPAHTSSTESIALLKCLLELGY